MDVIFNGPSEPSAMTLAVDDLDIAARSPGHCILRGLHAALILSPGMIIARLNLKEEICRTGS